MINNSRLLQVKVDQQQVLVMIARPNFLFTDTEINIPIPQKFGSKVYSMIKKTSKFYLNVKMTIHNTYFG